MQENIFIDILSLTHEERLALEEQELQVLNHIKTVSTNRIYFSEDYSVLIEYGSNTRETNLYGLSRENTNDMELHILKVLQGDDYALILEILKDISKETRYLNSTITHIVSTTNIPELMMGLLNKFDIDIEIKKHVLNSLMNLLDNAALSYTPLTSPDMLYIFNMLLDINDNDLSVLILRCVGIVAYRINFLNIPTENQPQFQ
jgi:hypothetical protein